MDCTQSASFPVASVAVQEITSPSNNSGGASFSTVTVPGQASEADKAGKLLLKAKFSPGSAFRVTVGGQLANTGLVTSGEHGLQASGVPVLQSSSMLLPHTSVASTTVTVRVQLVGVGPPAENNTEAVALRVDADAVTVTGLPQLSTALMPRLAGVKLTEAGQPGASICAVSVGGQVSVVVVGVQDAGFGVTTTCCEQVLVLPFPSDTCQ